MCGGVCFACPQNQSLDRLRWSEGRRQKVNEKIWLIRFMQYDRGFFDHESNRFECATSPFAAKVLPKSSV
jgi:hypothetical protein